MGSYDGELKGQWNLIGYIYYKEHPNNAVVKRYRGALDISYERL